MIRQASGSRVASRLLVGVVLLAISTVCPIFAFGGHRPKPHDLKREVEALEEQWRGAQLSGDIATMDRLLSDDYVGISMTGEVNTKAQQLDRIRKHLFQLTRLDLADMKVKLLGQVAIVTSRASVEATNNGAPVTGNFRYTRIYQHLPGGGWKITNFEATRIRNRGESKTVVASSPDHPRLAHDPPKRRLWRSRIYPEIRQACRLSRFRFADLSSASSGLS